MSDSDSTSDSEKKFIERGSHEEENSSDEDHEKGAVGGDKPKKFVDHVKSVATKIGRKLGRKRSKSPNAPSSSTTAPKPGTSELCVPGSGTKRGRSPSKSPPGDPTSKTTPKKPERSSSSVKDIMKKIKKITQPKPDKVPFVSEETDRIADDEGVGPPPKSPPPPPPTETQLENERILEEFIAGGILGSIKPNKEEDEDEGNTTETDIGPSSASTTPMEVETPSFVGDIPVPEDTSCDAAPETVDSTSGDAAPKTIDDSSDYDSDDGCP